MTVAFGSTFQNFVMTFTGKDLRRQAARTVAFGFIFQKRHSAPRVRGDIQIVEDLDWEILAGTFTGEIFVSDCSKTIAFSRFFQKRVSAPGARRDRQIFGTTFRERSSPTEVGFWASQEPVECSEDYWAGAGLGQVWPRGSLGAAI